MDNWVRELEKWCPTLNVVKYGGSKDDREQYLHRDRFPSHVHIVVSSYTYFSRDDAARDRKFLSKQPWEYLVRKLSRGCTFLYWQCAMRFCFTVGFVPTSNNVTVRVWFAGAGRGPWNQEQCRVSVQPADEGPLQATASIDRHASAEQLVRAVYHSALHHAGRVSTE